MGRRLGDPQAVAARLQAATRVLITTHTAPDGDAIGSELATAELLAAIDKVTVIANRDTCPAALAFLPEVEQIISADQLPARLPEAFDLGVVLDCADLDRTGIEGLESLPLVDIDHHLENAAFGAVSFVDEDAAATAELIVEVIDATGTALTPSMATNLHTALVTDTGDFRYANATPRAFLLAARLHEAGASPAAIARSLWEKVPARVIRLTGAVLSTLELELGGRLAVIHCDRAMLEAAGARAEDTEDLVNYARSIDGVEVAMFLKALTDEGVRVSLRSRGGIDVQAIASSLGGGGHREAAGCTLATPLAAARETLIGVVAAALERS